MVKNSLIDYNAMTNKMVARVLTCGLGLPSYGDSKLEKREEFKKTIV